MTAANKIVRCCVVCNECSDCYTHTLHELRELLLSIGLALADYGQVYSEKVRYGYSKLALISVSESVAIQLSKYKLTIRRLYDSIRQKTMSCLCDTEFQLIKEKVIRLIDMNRCKLLGVTDVTVDRSHRDQWIVANPECVAYEVWESNLIKCNASFAISVKKIEPIVRSLYAVVTKDQGNCVVKLLAYAHKASCERTLSASVKSKSECERELSVLVKTHKCKLSLKTYTRLLQCNLSFSLVSTLLGCGGKLSVGSDGRPTVKIGAKVSKIEDLANLASGTWSNLDNVDYEETYGV